MEDPSVINKTFGSVLCGQEVSDSFKIENTTRATQVLAVVPRDRDASEVVHERLQVRPLKATVQPGKSARFKLTYLSYLENRTDNYSYDICDGERVVAHLHVHAQSVGPSLSPAELNLKFFRFRDVRQNVRHIEITNGTKSAAKFYFDLDEDYQTIRICPSSGVLPAGSRIKFQLTFSPSEPGIYHKEIFCLVQFHSPIVFNIAGIHKPKLRIEPKTILLKYPPVTSYANSYEAYLGRVSLEAFQEEKKPFQKCLVESDMCLEEGSAQESDEIKQFPCLSVDEESESKVNSPSQKPFPEVVLANRFVNLGRLRQVEDATTLVNLSQTECYFYQWDYDPKCRFQVEPCRGIIEPNTKTNFSICFCPPAPDLLYHVELDIKIYPHDPERDRNLEQTVDLPLTSSLKIIGSSFPDDSCGWISQCGVAPKVLQLPSCVPGETVHGTFLIERRGHLPVTFEVVPPRDPNYFVQPSLGYLSTSFRLLVVEFNAKSREKGIYKEDLKIIFNSSPSTYDIIQFFTIVEIPEVIMGKDNSYTFESAFPRSRTSAVIPIKNPTTLSISYEFRVPDDITWVEVPTPTGVIEPMSRGEVKAIFKPECPNEYLDYIPCLVSSTSLPEYSETIYLRVVGSCQFGYLIATPSICDFGECLYKTRKSIKIHLHNFSPVLIHFRLETIHRAFPVGDPQKDVIVTPSRGSVPGKGSLEVEVTIIPHDEDVLQYAITCQNVESDAEGALPCDDPRTIFAFLFEGVLLGYQIKDVNVDAGGPLFSPHWIWKMMNINRINRALKSMTPKEEIEIKLPEAMKSSPPILIALLLEANSHGEVAWNSQTEVTCPCPGESVISASQREICNHEKSFVVVPCKTKMGPHQRLIVQLILNYSFPDTCNIQWTINLPYNRKLILNTSVVGLPAEELSFSSMYLTPSLSLKPVYVGDSRPPLQLFWLYNNTHRPTSYFVDKVTLREVTECVRGIFDCVNPQGVIPPFSSVPLAFSFKPNELKYYSVMFSVCIQEHRLISMTLSGEGVLYTEKVSEFIFEKTLPEKPILYNKNVALEMCLNFVNVPFLRTFSQTKRVFFIRNRSETEAWSFQWHHFRVENILLARVEPESGVVEPNQRKEVTLVLDSLRHPTVISFSIPCDVINYSLLAAYKASVRYREEYAEKCKDYFVITEKGTSCELPEVPAMEKPEPRHLFITVNVNIISELNIDQKLTHSQQIILRAGNELQPLSSPECRVKPSILPSIQQVLEKALWNILDSQRFKDNLKNLRESHDYNYLQIIPRSKKEWEKTTSAQLRTPSKAYVQNFLEDTLKEMLFNKSAAGDSEFDAKV